MGSAGQAGIQFGPNNTGKLYVSLHRHRGSGSTAYKNRWAPQVPPAMEYDIFCAADYGGWVDVNGHYWGVDNGGVTILGDQGERLCKFPRNDNPRVPWHGYPVSPLQNGSVDAPPFAFVEDWIRHGVVSRTVGRRIQKWKI